MRVSNDTVNEFPVPSWRVIGGTERWRHLNGVASTQVGLWFIQRATPAPSRGIAACAAGANAGESFCETNVTCIHVMHVYMYMYCCIEYTLHVTSQNHRSQLHVTQTEHTDRTHTRQVLALRVK